MGRIFLNGTANIKGINTSIKINEKVPQFRVLSIIERFLRLKNWDS